MTTTKIAELTPGPWTLDAEDKYLQEKLKDTSLADLGVQAEYAMDLAKRLTQDGQ